MKNLKNRLALGFLIVLFNVLFSFGASAGGSLFVFSNPGATTVINPNSTHSFGSLSNLDSPTQYSVYMHNIATSGSTNVTNASISLAGSGGGTLVSPIGNFTVNPQETVSLTVSIDPSFFSSAGTYTWTATISSDSITNPTYVINLQITITSGEIDVERGGGVTLVSGSGPNFLDGTNIGQVAPGITQTRNFTLKNEGVSNLELLPATITGVGYTITSPPLPPSLAPGGSVPLQVVFDSTGFSDGDTPGASLQIANSDINSNSTSENPYTINFIAEIKAPDVLVQNPNNFDFPVPHNSGATINRGTDFGSVAVGSSKLSQLEIVNLGGAPLSGINITTASPDFSIAPLPAPPTNLDASGGANDSGFFVIQFTPSSEGPKSASISIFSNDPDPQPAYSFQVIGNGDVPTIEVEDQGGDSVTLVNSPSTTNDTNFGVFTSTATPNATTFVINNTGTTSLDVASLDINLVSLSGVTGTGFSIVSFPGAPIMPGSSGNLVVQFDPLASGVGGAAGVYNDTVTIQSNDPDYPNPNYYKFNVQATIENPQEIEVRDSANAVVLGAPPLVTIDIGDISVNAGGFIDATYDIHNLGDTNLEISSIFLTNNTNFSILVPSPVPSSSSLMTVGGLSSAPLTVRFNNTAGLGVGTYDTQVTIISNDADEQAYIFEVQATVIGPDILAQGGTPYQDILNGSGAGGTNGTDFGMAAIGGAFVPHLFRVVNNGTEDLVITSAITITDTSSPVGTNFILQSPFQPSAPIPPGGDFGFVINFAPSVPAGTKTAIVTIPSNDPDTPSYTFQITGEAVSNSALISVNGNGVIVPDATTVASALPMNGTDLQDVNYNDGAVTQVFSIYNGGTTALGLDGIQFTDPLNTFTLTGPLNGPLPTSVAAGTSEDIWLTLTPNLNNVGQQVFAFIQIDPTNADNDAAIQGEYDFAVVADIVAPEIEITGAGVTIPNGSTNPPVNSPDDRHFGTVDINTGSETRIFTIVNNGGAQLNIVGTAAIGGTPNQGFTITGQPNSPVAANGGTTTIEVTFDPSAVGAALTNNVAVLTDDPNGNSLYTFEIRADAVEDLPVMELYVDGNANLIADDDANSPDALNGTNLGNVNIASAPIDTVFIIDNTNGTDQLNINGINVPSSSGFALDPMPTFPINIAAGGTDTFTLKFTPGSVGPDIASVDIFTNASNLTTAPFYDFEISANVVEEEIEVKGLNGNSVNILPATAIQSDGTFFPDTDINAAGPAVQIFTIVNDGTAPLEIDTIGSPSTEFETASLSSFTVNPGVPETFEVRFMPSAVGNFTDDVTITLLGGLPDFVFQVQGNGIDITTPTIDIIGVPPTSFEPFTVTVQFSEGVTGFYDSDIDVTNGSVTSFMYVSDSEYEVEITPAANGQVDISIPDTIAVSTDDGEPNAASAVFSSIYTEPTTPTVVINGAPTNTSGPFDVTFNFSEDVSGFDETDIVLINANIVSSSFTIISPSEYTATIVPVNDGQVTIDVPAGVANATAPGNLPNAAAVQVVVEYQGTPYVAITQEVIASFMINRTNNILANQPSLMNFLKGDNVYGGGKYGNLSGDANAGGYNFNFNTSLSRMRYNQAMQDYYPGQGAMPSAKPKVGNYDVWTQLSGSWAETGSAESNLLNMYIGSHYVFSENFMLGAMLEFDWAEEEGAVGNSQANGFGWLIGPYIVGAIPEYNIFYEAYIGYGHSSNEVNPFGTYVDEFGSKRLFVNAKIGGRIELEELNFDQELSVSYIKDKQETYTDSRGNIIPSQVISVGEAKFGSTVNSTMEFGDAQITPEFGVSGVVNFAVEEGAQPIEMPWDEGVRLRLDTGINYRAGRFDLDGGAFYDGVITDDYNNYGVDFKAKINF